MAARSILARRAGRRKATTATATVSTVRMVVASPTRMAPRLSVAMAATLTMTAKLTVDATPETVRTQAAVTPSAQWRWNRRYVYAVPISAPAKGNEEEMALPTRV